MNFPYINNITDLLPYIESNPQFRVQVQPNGMTVVCYMLQDEDTFRGEHEDYYKECRGITFGPDGRVVSRTLHKFQNVGENDSTQPDMIPWSDITRIMDKRDGSMITFVEVNGDIVAKTKKTFTSNEAIAATEFLHKDPDRVAWVRAILNAGFTPTFEWTSPRFPIVLLYEKDELTILQIRENISGRYLTETEIRFWLPTFKPNLFPIVENLIEEFTDMFGGIGDGEDNTAHFLKCASWQKLRDAAETREGIEGWIVQTDDGQMWKVKTKWYVNLHHSVTFTRWRDIARSVLADESDDLKAAFALTGRSLAPIIEVETKINRELRIIEDAVELHVQNGKALGRTQKDMALAFKGHELFGFVMGAFVGKTPDYRGWYLKDKIRTWSLQVIVQNEDIEVPSTKEEV